jgi:glycosyltransferase involved in cell wall biosynthesis
VKKSKIYVYAICKNEEAFIDRWMDAVSEADGVVVVDTGSEDGTVEKLKKRGAYVYEEKFTPWRFDTARNSAMNHVPEDADICVSNDIDEVFESGWREHLEQSWDKDCTRAGYWFVWEEKSEQSPEKRFIMEKIHKRHGYKWVHPVHEVLVYNGSIPEKNIFIENIKLVHKPDPGKSRGQYLPLLELSSRENPNDDRTKFWLGREYIYKGRNDDGIQTLTEHLEMPSAIWNEERSASMRFIARAYRAKGDDYNARIWLYRAAAECMVTREPWMELARLGYETEDWPLTLWASMQGLKVKTSSRSYLVEPEAWGYLLDDFVAIAAYRLGFFQIAYEHATIACSFAPNDERLRQNLAFIMKELDGGESDE